MAQRKQVSWAQLRVGLLVVVALTIFALMVFLMTGQGYFNRKTALTVYVENAGGLKKGDPVRLAGIDIGNVDDIAVSTDPKPTRAVVVSFHVEAAMMKEVRKDSVATLEVEGLLGQRFIDIRRGSAAQPKLAAGEELLYKPQADFGVLMASSTTVMTNVNRMVNSLTKVSDQMESGKGTFGKLVFDDSLYKQLNKGVSDLQGMVNYVASGQGSLGKAIYTDDLYNKADAVADKFDGMMNDVKDQKGTFGKLLYDTSLHDDMRKFVNNGNALLTDIKAGKGTLGKFMYDDAFYNKSVAALDKIDTIAGRIERGEGTLGKMTMKDDPLHANLNNLTLETQELLKDFRKNPKKFLTIQLKIF
jgi:phospholipid/cholesterol/gamma-HCH transport system substrate-binding protein